MLPIAPSTYYLHAARRANPAKRPARARRDEQFLPQVQRVWHENYEVYGAKKVWKQLQRERQEVALCRVARLMRKLGIADVLRVKPVRTTFTDPARPCPRDRVNRQFKAERPNQLWVSDYTFVSTWQ